MADPVEPQRTPFSASIGRMLDGNHVLQLRLVTGAVILIMSTEEMREFGSMCLTEATGIVVPSGNGQRVVPTEDA